MTISAITEIFEDAISARCVKNFGRKYEKIKLQYVKKSFLYFHKDENSITIRAFPAILHS
jgi:hypothetical protein